MLRRKKYWRGFHLPPEICPVVFPPYSMLPHDPLGQRSLNIQIVVPKTLEARHDSIVVLWFSACPSMLWYSCFLYAASPVALKS